MSILIKLIAMIQMVIMVLSGMAPSFTEALEARQAEYSSVEEYQEDDIYRLEVYQMMDEFRDRVEDETGYSFEYIEEMVSNGHGSEWVQRMNEVYGIDFEAYLHAVYTNDVDRVIEILYEAYA